MTLTATAAIPWQERPIGEDGVLWRSSLNPIITPDAVPHGNSIFNSAVVPFGDGFAGVFRVDDDRRVMNLHAGRSKDGVAWDVEAEPIAWAPADGRVSEVQERFLYSYDPRVTWLDDRFYVTWCNGYHGPTIGVGYTHDFRTFHQLDNAFLPFNRNGVLFPRRIGGRYGMLSRPSDDGHTPFGEIYWSESPDLVHWGRHRHVMAPVPLPGRRPRSAPARRRSRPTRAGSCSTTACSRRATGSSTRSGPPCSTSTSRGGCGPGGAATCSRRRPCTSAWATSLTSCSHAAALVDRDRDRLTLYYGAADAVVCLAHGRLSEIVASTRA